VIFGEVAKRKNTEMKSCGFPLREIFFGELFHAISRLNFEGRRVFALPLLHSLNKTLYKRL
jgi:hypothetical protein